jgi:hypothetical protein
MLAKGWPQGGTSKRSGAFGNDLDYAMLIKMYEGDSETLRVTPAMEAGVSDHVWSSEEIAALA